MLIVTNENSHVGMIKIPVIVSPQATQSLGCVLWSLSLRLQAEACDNLDKVLEMISATLRQISLIETFGYRAKAKSNIVRCFNYSNWFSWKKGFTCNHFIQCFICFSQLLGKPIQCQVSLLSWKVINSSYGIDDMHHFMEANDYLSYAWRQWLQFYLSSSLQRGLHKIIHWDKERKY